ncbi:MAG: outer membrane protein assembly factor BamE [Burkholderiaceae bacterium]
MPIPRFAFVVMATFALPGCQTISSVGSGLSSGVSSFTGWAPTFLGPYRPDVHQGNIITKEMVEQLRLGMTREQVRFMLGTPLLTSEFHKDRWDYAYYLNPRKGEVQNRRLTVYFKDNKLESFKSDEMPQEIMANVLILGPDAQKKPRTAPRQPEKAPEIQTPPPGREATN